MGYAADRHTRALEQQLASVLRWETLWQDTPESFRIPPSHSARFMLYRLRNDLSYCSQETRTCAKYRIDEILGLQRLDSRECCGAQSDEEALMAFVGLDPAKIRHPGDPPPSLNDDMVRNPSQSLGVLWDATLPLEDRDKIVAEYKRARPPALGGLKRYLAELPPEAGFRSITIACFEPTDPAVYCYGVHSERGPVVFTLYWDIEREGWFVASSTEGTESLATIEKLRSVIESIRCATIHFKK